MKKTIVIIHFPLLSIPLINSIIYLLQIKLLEIGYGNFIFLSRRRNKIKNKLFQFLKDKDYIVILNNFYYISEMNNRKIRFILNQDPIDFSNSKRNEIYRYVWGAFQSDFISYKIHNILQKNKFPKFLNKKVIVMPNNNFLDFTCDFLMQTAKELSNRGDVVFVIAKHYSQWLLDFSRNKNFSSLRKNFQNFPGIYMVFPKDIFPKILHRYKVLYNLNWKFINFYCTIFIRLLKPDFIWSFDQNDLEITKSTPKETRTIYDCVDYFSSLDPIIDKKIKKRENALIRQSDYFFVNSHALEKIKSEIRVPTAVVPQGFDLDSFEKNPSLGKKEKVEITKIKKILSDIRKPIVGFIGNLTYRIDFNLLHNIAKRLPDVSFVITGGFLPMPDDDRFVRTNRQISKLKKLPNLYFIPLVQSRKTIKAILKNYTIGMIPYKLSYDFNKYCHPMKLFEYFYMGLPVVSTPIEELKLFPNHVYVGNTSELWIKHIKKLLQKPWSKNKKQKQLKLSVENSWKNKIDKIYKYL